jgi:hypothetical protein
MSATLSTVNLFRAHKKKTQMLLYPFSSEQVVVYLMTFSSSRGGSIIFQLID